MRNNPFKGRGTKLAPPQRLEKADAPSGRGKLDPKAVLNLASDKAFKGRYTPDKVFDKPSPPLAATRDRDAAQAQAITNALRKAKKNGFIYTSGNLRNRIEDKSKRPTVREA